MSVWLHAVNADSEPLNPRKHDLSKPCIVCQKKGHTFKDCEVLNNHSFLKVAFIKVCIFLSTLQRARANINMNSLCAEMNISPPDEAECDQLWEDSKEYFDPEEDFHEAGGV